MRYLRRPSKDNDPAFCHHGECWLDDDDEKGQD